MESTAESCVERHQLELRRHFRWNYVMHCVEGGLFIGGIAFVNPNTLLPTIVESMGGSAWLISLMPVMMAIGFVWPPLFTAHLIEKLPFVKPVLLLTGLVQRLPYLVAAAILFFFSGTLPALALSAVALAPLLSGIFGGFTITAWLELVAKTVPENRRSSMTAIRFIIGALVGIAAGAIIAAVLHRYPGELGYGLLHLLAFLFLMASYLLFATIRETSPPHDPCDQPVRLQDNLRSIPAIIRGDRRLLDYLFARSLMNGLYIVTPFLAIHALRVLGREESYVGYLVTTQMVGSIVGNIVAGYLGDRFGGKCPMILARLTFLGICLWSPFAASAWEFEAIFALFGAAFYGDQVGTTTLCIEISPPKKRATYLAIITTLTMPSMLIASVLSTLLWTSTSGFFSLAALTGGCMVASLFYLHRVEEPRPQASEAL